MLRIKAWLVLVRNAMRDYLDVVALADRLGDKAAPVLVTLDDYYADQVGAGGARLATQLARQLAEPRPYDLSAIDLEHYRRLEPRWRDWDRVAQAARALATQVVSAVAEQEG
jgi:hypothetical protein